MEQAEFEEGRIWAGQLSKHWQLSIELTRSKYVRIQTRLKLAGTDIPLTSAGRCVACRGKKNCKSDRLVLLGALEA